MALFTCLGRHSSPNDSGRTTLPFGGLGLDLTEVRRQVRGLVLECFRKQEAPLWQPRIAQPTEPTGYRLLLRLSRETLGS